MSRNPSHQFSIDYDNIKRVSYAAIIDRCLAHPVENLITAHQNKGGKIIPVSRDMLKGGLRHIYAGFFGSLLSAIPIRISTYSTFFVAHDYFKKNEVARLQGLPMHLLYQLSLNLVRYFHQTLIALESYLVVK